jgi:hypothetical protein
MGSLNANIKIKIHIYIKVSDFPINILSFVNFNVINM